MTDPLHTLGVVEIDAADYIHRIRRGDDLVDEPIPYLDTVYTLATRVHFTLDYPFETPFTGVILGEITLRRTIDAIRAAYRAMYANTTIDDIPGVENQRVLSIFIGS